MSVWEKINSRRNSTYLVLAVGIVFIAIILVNTLARNPSAYESKLQQFRENRNLFFKNSPESPIDRDLKPQFEGLAYFPANEAFVCEATLARIPRPDTLRMLMTNGTFQRMVKLGTVTFTLQQRLYSLTAFRTPEAIANSELFIPFTDLSSGNSTYGGGRYLNVAMQEPLVLDFNYAYHPDCLYNDGFACPIPPSENRIDVEIAAGERLPEGLGS